MYDWTAEPIRPLSTEDVWTMMLEGCNCAEVATAARVSELAAKGMMVRAAADKDIKTLRLKR